MRKWIFGMIGVASIFLAANVYAAGTATVKFDTATITTLTSTTETVTNLTATTGTITTLNVPTTFKINGTDTTKAAAFTDNQGSKMDSGTAEIVDGTVTVTTNLTACDRVFVQQVAYGSNSVNWLATTSGTGFTAKGYYGTGSTEYVGTATIHWLAIDE